MSRGHESAESKEGGQEFETLVTFAVPKEMAAKPSFDNIKGPVSEKLKELYGESAKLVAVVNIFQSSKYGDVVIVKVRYKKEKPAPTPGESPSGDTRRGESWTSADS